MPKTEPVQAAPTAAPANENKKQTMSKWSAFTSASVAPTRIKCDGYRSFHRYDASCHTVIVPDAEIMAKHLEAEHSGGFLINLRKADKPWPGWKKFEDLGLEIVDFRCDVCDKQVAQHPMHIMNHMKAHSGKTRRSRDGGVFNITLSLTPTISEEDAFTDDAA